jgi:hypothetical protein
MFLHHQSTPQEECVEITTCSYREFPKLGRDDLAPVGITLGFPRGTRYPVRMWKGLAPKSGYFKSPPDVFARSYVDDLNDLGSAQILQTLQGIAEEEGKPNVCLLCFEDLGNPGLWCHRTLFREWWLEATGEELHELGRVYRAPAPPEPDLLTQLESGDRE